MVDLVRENKQKFNAGQQQFQGIFGVPLHRFWHPLFGFDVIKFDEWLGTPDGTSTHDHILNTKGQGALTLVEGLI